MIDTAKYRNWTPAHPDCAVEAIAELCDENDRLQAEIAKLGVQRLMLMACIDFAEAFVNGWEHFDKESSAAWEGLKKKAGYEALK